MAKLSLAELKTAVASYVDASKIAVNSFSATYNNVVGLLDQIGKIVTLDTGFFDKLPELDGDFLPEGKGVEEYYFDLIAAMDWNQDEDGSRAMKFWSPTHRPVAFSQTLGRKIIPVSIPNNNIERAVNNMSQFVEIVAMIEKRLSDSKAMWKYGVKRQLLGTVLSKIDSAYSGATAYVDATTDITEGTFYKQGSPAVTTVCVKAKTHAVGDTYATLQAGGYLIPINLAEEVPVPEDTSTGEAFIKAVRNAVEISQDVSEGYSFNGNTIGAEEGLVLYVKQGVTSVLDVDTMAGAFHLDKIALPVEIKVIKDFGSYSGKAYALLGDRRGVKLHLDYEAIRENFNGFGDFLSLYSHIESTGWISRNAFFHAFLDD